jgi:arsenate reductase-like glutaredoxin family protein
LGGTRAALKRGDGREKPGMSVTLYHNPACGTARSVLAILRKSGQEPRVVTERGARLCRPGETARDLLG